MQKMGLTELTSSKFGISKNCFFVQFEALETDQILGMRTELSPNLMFEVKMFQKYVISGRVLRN